MSKADASFILGADVSSLQKSLDLGAKYFDADGASIDPLQMLKDHGVNYIRLRVWVNPVHSYNTAAKLLEFAPKVKSMGMKLLVDFHYSDTWTDPEHQVKPVAWAAHSFEQLLADVYDHTFDVCSRLKSAGLAPDMIQVGNEINPGMLLPEGGISNWPQLGTLLKRGYRAAKACSPSIQVMLHLANAGDLEGTCDWFDHACSEGVEWDVIGLSYYSYWHGSLSDMRNTVQEARRRYDKPVMIVETAYPFTLLEGDNERNVVYAPAQLTEGFPATPAGQRDNLASVVKVAKEGGAAGVFYWEPTWTVTKGNGWNPAEPQSGDQWENQALFDYQGRVLPALKTFRP